MKYYKGKGTLQDQITIEISKILDTNDDRKIKEELGGWSESTSETTTARHKRVGIVKI